MTIILKKVACQLLPCNSRRKQKATAHYYLFCFFFALRILCGLMITKKTHASFSLCILICSSLFVFAGCAHKSVPVPANETSSLPQSQPVLQVEGSDETVSTVSGTGQEPAEVVSADSSSENQEDNDSALVNKEPADDDQSLLDAALELTDTAQEYWEDDDMDHAIESLDQAYALMLKVPNTSKLSQQKEDLRFMISKRITEMYASRQVAVKGNHNAIPLVVNDHVQREIQSFQTQERDFFLESYKRSGRYRGEMVKALKDAGLPEELSWLPLIESGFKVRALSRSRAFGLWQFIPSTGYKYGLRRNAWIDERLDPEKSTAAAIAYFRELHQMFGDWATVLAAYNCGEGSVARVIREQKVNYLDNFWDFYERLPRETARYFPRFLAVLAIINDPAKYGFTLDEPDKPLSCETVTIDRPVKLSTVAEQLGIDEEDLSALNPELRREATPNTAYALKVPPGKGDVVLASLDKMPKWSPPKVEFVVHRVRRGETLSLIALRYRTSMRKILDANNLRSGRLLRIGQRLKIPMRHSSTT
jgi:peptidoglycan lytic transglycosylase D